MNREGYERRHELAREFRDKPEMEAEFSAIVRSLIEMQTELKQHLGKRLPIVKEGDTTDFAALVRIHHRLIELIGP